MNYERLSPQDSIFLHVENEHQPMHVGAMGYLEAAPFFDATGRFRLDDVRQRINSRLHLVPRFRRRIMNVPFDQGRPVWVDDPDFDLAYHVRLTALPGPGNESQMRALMGRLQSQMLDRRRPLWEIWFVEGVEGDRVGLIQKTHHCLIDGMSGIDVATVLFDLEPEPPEIEAPEWHPLPPPDKRDLLVESLVERAVEPAELVRSVRAAFRGPQQVADKVGTMARAALDMGQRPPMTPLNVPISPHRRFEVARVPLSLARAIKKAAGCTINDVVLAACTSALADFLDGRGVLEPGLILKAMAPVSVRDESEKMALGNRVSMMVADLPVGEPDALERLEFVSAHMDAVKSSGQAVGADAIMGITGYAPPTLLALGARLAVRAMPINLTITNVPGPQFPLYCMGARVLEAFPFVGILDKMALTIALISYDGELGFGLTGDRDVVPDLSVIAEGIEDGFAELARLLDIQPPAPAPAPMRAVEPPAKPVAARKAAGPRKAPAKKRPAAASSATTAARKKTAGA